MAAELIAGALLTTSFERFFNMIISGEVLNFVSGKKLDDGLRKKFKTTLLSVNAVLNDAEKKQISDQNVRQWLDELKDIMYNAEDLVYEIDTETLRCKLESQSRSRAFQVLNLFSSKFSVKNLEDRIVEILHTLEHIVNQKVHLGLISEGVENKSSTPPLLLPLEEESDIYGRDDDKAVIVKLLLSDDDVVGGNKISVIPIVGMGGIGKTTLARLVYNDVRVMENFDIKAWITVSNEFEVFKLTKTIFEIITKQENCRVKHPDQLQCELKKVMEGKKFLFVLDDVWNENYNSWNTLKSQFTFGAPGSKIIVTTRNEKIGSMMGTIPNHYLGIISDEDCWQLFAKHAFQKAINPSVVQDFEEVGRKIIRKCNGLPLAVKSLGGLLCSKKYIKEWKDILDNDIWELPVGMCDILPALWLSYYYLPPHLKRCFAYCSIFPKDYIFQKEKLILLWMAEDLLQSQPNKMLEEAGEEYFNDLTSRSFFHRSEDGFSMHDLVNDLACFVSSEFCFRLDDNYSKVLTNKTRHLSCMRYKSYDKTILKDLSNNKILRTLILNGHTLLDKQDKKSKKLLIHPQELENLPCLRVLSLYGSPITIFLDLFGNLKLLRYLDLSWSEIKELPDTIWTLYNLQTLSLRFCTELSRLSNSIGNLKHLRYLDLSLTRIKELPDTVCDLQNLHTLNLQCCIYLSRLPTNLSRLVNLRNLDISHTSLREIPPHMSKLKHLQGLSDFFVGGNSGTNIKELANLQALHGVLRIRNLENVVNVGDVSEANLKDKKHIREVELEWCGETDDSEKAREVLDRLQPHNNVQALTISNYQGTSFPSWIGHHSFSHIVTLHLNDCRNCYWLPPLGQLPSLKDLYITGLDMVERIGDEFYSTGSSSIIIPPFKSLKALSFSCMPQWKEWSLMGGDKEGGAFSQLKRLQLTECPKINGNCLSVVPHLTSLSIWRCRQLVASLESHLLPSLGSLELHNCSKAVSFPEGGLPSNIHTITISGCDKLESLAKEGWPSNLKRLEISYCNNLFVHADSFPEEGQFPTTLTSLKLRGLPNLKSLNGKALGDLVCLEQLCIEECSNLRCLPEGLPASVSQLISQGVNK